MQKRTSKTDVFLNKNIRDLTFSFKLLRMTQRSNCTTTQMKMEPMLLSLPDIYGNLKVGMVMHYLVMVCI